MIDRQFLENERAIEGLPIRLVIALVVGVAALTVMSGMIDGITPPMNNEVHWEVAGDASGESDRVVRLSGDGELSDGETVPMEIVDENGNLVESGTVVIRSGSAQLSNGPIVKQITSGEVEVAFDDSQPELRSGQVKGTLKVEIEPPKDGNYEDKRSNAEIVVVEGG